MPTHVAARLAKLRIAEPTPVQRTCLESLMPRGPSHTAAAAPPRHAVIRWPTGSGKTLAFTLPLLAHLDMHSCGSGVQALVVAPTRELVLQTLHTLQALVGRGKANAKGHRVKVMALLGRRTPRLESELRNRPPDVAVGTPQTIAGLIERGLLPLHPDRRRRTLVLDEV